MRVEMGVKMGVEMGVEISYRQRGRERPRKAKPSPEPLPLPPCRNFLRVRISKEVGAAFPQHGSNAESNRDGG